MRRAEVLDTAKSYVTNDRQTTHGKPEDTFGVIADLWSAYLQDVEVTAVDVAHMMALLKIARAKHNPYHSDNHIDLAGYAACASELADDELDRTDAMQYMAEVLANHQVEISDVE